MILPLFAEQFLAVFIGMTDVFVIAFVGEEAVSGVSLVNAFNVIFINLFLALASGGAVVISQYMGRRDWDRASQAASQLVTATVLFSLAMMVLVLLLDTKLLSLLFPCVEESVMDSCITYLQISALSYPAMAIYNAGTAVYRSLGRTSTTLYIAIAANIINIVGDCLGVFWFHAGVAGVAWPSLLSRSVSAAVITFLCLYRSPSVRYRLSWMLYLSRDMQRRILKIAVPNGIESGVFQLVKVALSTIVAMFGTYQIAANGVAQSVWSMAALTCTAMGPVFITVIGRCMGAGDTDQAVFYMKKLLKINLVLAVVWNSLIFAVTPVILGFYSLDEETKDLIILLVLIHNLFNALVFPFADPLGKGLRAAGDAMFTAGISLFTTIGVRMSLSLLFGFAMNLGVIGVACAMCLDWTLRGAIFWIRFKRGTWQQFRVI